MFLEDVVKENAQTIYLDLENLKSLAVRVSKEVKSKFFQDLFS